MSYQPKTGEPCNCRKGVQRDNCPECEGTGMRIDFRAIRERAKAVPVSQNPKVRAEKVCPNCLQGKDVGLVLCWPCHHSQKDHNDGDYSKRCKAKIAAREAAL